jgi:hypothetical protein
VKDYEKTQKSEDSDSDTDSEDARRGEEKKSRVEPGSNTSTVTLRIEGGDEKGSLESETVKYVHESYGTRTRE